MQAFYLLSSVIDAQGLETLSDLRNNTNLPSLLLGSFFGLQIIMAFYNLLLYFSLKDRAYLLYFGIAIFGVLSLMSIHRLGNQFIWTGTNADEYLYMTFSGLNIFCSSRFAAVFLNLKILNKRLDNFMWYIAILSLLWSVLSLILTVEQVTPFGRWLVLLSFPSYIVVAIIVYRQGLKLAKYYLIAWIPYAIGLVTAALVGARWIPENNFTVFALHYGGALEIVLLSFALAYRIKDMRIELAEKELEKEQFKTKLLQEQKVVLEQKVEERTAALSEANATKDKFFSIIAHDLRSPMIGLQGVGEKLTYFIKKNKQDKLLKLGGQIDTSIDQLNHLLNNLLNWAATQTGGIPNNPETLNIVPIINENINLYQSLAKAKEVNFDTNLEESKILVDANAIATIIRNLLSNAIKFTKSNSIITITTKADNSNVILSIKDEGKGMSAEKINQLFKDKSLKSSTGTSGEKGFGLGLQLCKEFVDINRGQIYVNSNIDEGTEFVVTFPKTN